MPIEELINKMRAHDWYYEHSDDQRAWQKGLSERAEIYELFSHIPSRDIERLVLENIPKDAQANFITMLSCFNKTIRNMKEKI